MLIINLIKTAVVSVNTFLRDKKAYAELSRLDIRLLEDMGVQLVKGKVVDTRAAMNTESKRVAHASLTLIVNDNARYERTESPQFEPSQVATAS